jgi:uncharacterized membrane protein
MADVPTQAIVAAFKTEDGADNALAQLRSVEKQHLIDINNVAVLRCDQQGKVHIKEPTDMGGGRGAAIGAVVGGIAGLLFPPAMLATAAGGAAIGGIAARLRDSGFDDDRLRELGKSLQPGTSALLAVIEHTWVREVEEELAKAGADVATKELGADIAAELKAGHDVAYTAVVTDDAVAVARVAETDAPPVEGAAQSQKAVEGAAEQPAKAEPSAPPSPAKES